MARCVRFKQRDGYAAAPATVFAASVRAGMDELDMRMLTFSTLIIPNLALIAVNRPLTRPTWTTLGEPNPALRWLARGAVGLLAAMVYVAILCELFRVATLHANDAAVVAVAIFGAFV